MVLSVNIEKRLPGFSLDMSMSCEKGITGIVGASGSGKSMLLNCIAGLIKPDEGTISLGDRVFFNKADNINLPPQNRRASILFQNYALFPHMTIKENIAFALDGLAVREKNRRVSRLLEQFHISDFAGRYPSQISGGQQQRAALARALAVEPDILLLDEPFSALDQHLKQNLMREMLEMLSDYEGCVLFVTHNMEEAFRMCERLTVIENGHIEAQGLKQDIFNRPPSCSAAKITGCKNIVTAIKSAEHEVYVPDWGVSLKSEMSFEGNEGFAGIRANHIKLAEAQDKENCFTAWIADRSESTFSNTLYLKFGEKPYDKDDFQLQCEINKDRMKYVDGKTEKVNIHIDPQHVFFTYR
ncbi:MAG: ATP-binding cassette domain-containing protein [Clostridia bacterium]|nr:ATP-binding cassette domain-containing protein [Clostridia bacterium]